MDRIFADLTTQRDLAQPAYAIILGEPQVAIGSHCDAKWPSSMRQGILTDLPPGRDAPNLVPSVLGKPQVAIGSGRDAHRTATVGGDGILGVGPLCGHLTNAVAGKLQEPEIAIGTTGDTALGIVPLWQRVLGDLASDLWQGALLRLGRGRSTYKQQEQQAQVTCDMGRVHGPSPLLDEEQAQECANSLCTLYCSQV
jgi:hypothetical protein